jgi:hypothetical protein
LAFSEVGEADLPKAEVDALIRAMAPGEATAFEYHWRYRC